MKRRSFLVGSAGGVLSAAAKRTSTGHAQGRKSNDDPAVVVVGAGIFGVWTAFYLQHLGAHVTLIDAYGPGNSRASSGGETRILRSDYGGKHHYTRMNIRAHELWSSWQEEWKTDFMYSTGRLTFYDESARERMISTTQYLESEGIVSHILSQEEISYRWPQIDSTNIGFGVYYPGDAGGSALMAREACRIVGEKFQEIGGHLLIDKVSITAKRPRFTHVLRDGSPLSAEKVVFACGPWMGKMFPDLFGKKLNVYRRDVFFVGPKAGDDQYSYPNLPIWSFNNAEDSRFYGLPDIRGRGVKIAPWPDMNSIDMDHDDRFNNQAEIKRIRSFIKRRFPGLVDQPFLEGRVCQLTFNKDEEFIIDQHPEDENVWFACGGSGHAFKHGPALGEYIAKRVLGMETPKEYQGKFRL